MVGSAEALASAGASDLKESSFGTERTTANRSMVEADIFPPKRKFWSERNGAWDFPARFLLPKKQEFRPVYFSESPWGNATEADVVVRVGRGIVQIQREKTSIRPIVPIAAPFESVFWLHPSYLKISKGLNYLNFTYHPPSSFPISSSFIEANSYCFIFIRLKSLLILIRILTVS